MNVLVAIDGSPSATTALELAAAIAWPAPTRIDVLHVEQRLDEDLGVPASKYPSVHARIRDQIEAQLGAVPTSSSWDRAAEAASSACCSAASRGTFCSTRRAPS